MGTLDKKTPLQRFAAKLARSAVGRAQIKEAIDDVKAGRLLNEEDFFARLEEKQRTKRLHQLTDLIPSVAMHQLRPDQTNLDVESVDPPARVVETATNIREQRLKQAEQRPWAKRMERELV